ncbi:ABC transporter ATP-binding protein [Mumia quercus]|uniref:ABC transporter ATP-binding protein n=1 Tax=Mumia quercus TaxID=2976125 RepID=UPI0021D1A2AD|nr:oligopeptide/dipeptide ABC transporter ATP-binding protein [Mumia quercus]
MTDTDVVLEVRDLAKSYPVRRGVVFKREVGTVRAVDGVSLTLRRGKTLGLVGESGSGKSTLAKLLVGVEKPTRGQILVDGVDVSELGRADRRRLRSTLQMVFQDPYTSLNPRMSVGEIVGEAYAIHPDVTPPGGRDKAVRELLDRVGLNPDHVNRYPHQFSGGQRQRIGIARALAVRPRILICDEPVSALDVSIQGQVVNLLEELQDDLGLSYLFIAHDLSVVRHIADEVAVMYLGRIVEAGGDAEVYDRTSHPYTRALMSAVPVPDPTRREDRAIVLEGDMPSPSDPPSGCHFHTRCWLAPTVADPSSGETRPDGARIPSVCRHDSPKLAPQESPDHLAACHFALDAPRR